MSRRPLKDGSVRATLAAMREAFGQALDLQARMEAEEAQGIERSAAERDADREEAIRLRMLAQNHAEAAAPYCHPLAGEPAPERPERVH